MQHTLNVQGMTCSHCEAAVTSAIKGVDPHAVVELTAAAVASMCKANRRAMRWPLRLPTKATRSKSRGGRLRWPLLVRLVRATFAVKVHTWLQRG